MGTIFPDCRMPTQLGAMRHDRPHQIRVGHHPIGAEVVLVGAYPIKAGLLGVDLVFNVAIEHVNTQLGVELFVRHRPILARFRHTRIGHVMGIGKTHGSSPLSCTFLLMRPIRTVARDTQRFRPYNVRALLGPREQDGDVVGRGSQSRLRVVPHPNRLGVWRGSRSRRYER